MVFSALSDTPAVITEAAMNQWGLPHTRKPAPEEIAVPDAKAVATPDAKLDGVHHFTGVTADVTANVDFWCRILGLRFVKKTLNFETTFRYHTYYGDEEVRPGSVVTFLEFNELERERPGPGNIQRIVLRVGSYD